MRAQLIKPKLKAAFATKCIGTAIGLLLAAGIANAQSSIGGPRKPASQVGGPNVIANPVVPPQRTAPPAPGVAAASKATSSRRIR